MEKPSKQTGVPAVSKTFTWVSTEKSAHEAWMVLTLKKPIAAALMHKLASLVDIRNCGIVVISQSTLAGSMGCCVRTVKRATKDLIDGKWIQKIHLGGLVYGYALNSEVAWIGHNANKYETASFTATVVVPRNAIPQTSGLRKLPYIFPPDEIALPVETGGESGSQMQISGMEPSVELQKTGEPSDFTQVQLDFEPPY